MFYSCLVLSFDVCIATITWSLLFVVIALWVICPTQQITLTPRSSSGLPMLDYFLEFHWLTRKHLVSLMDMVSKFKSFSEALVCCYCSVGYLSLLFVVIALWVICLTQQITLAPRSSSGLPMLDYFLEFHWLTRKHLVSLMDMVSKFKSFSEAPHLSWKCGTHMSDSPVRNL
jgi:hypothetical protein